MQYLDRIPQDKGVARRIICAATGLFLGIRAASACDIALALAVDVSGSVDPKEYQIQMQGLADALRDATVADALVAAKAAVLLVEWTGDSRQMVAVPWTRIIRFEDALTLAQRVQSAPRAWRNYSTAIGAALEFTAAQFGTAPPCRRRVIDVSGDGSSNEGVDPASLRHQLWQAGFTVNALVIEGSEPDLTAYFWENVIAGDKAFVISANGFADYPARIKLKLLREVTEQVSDLPSAPAIRVSALRTQLIAHD